MSVSPNMPAWLVSFKHIEMTQILNTEILAWIRMYQWWLLWKCVASMWFRCLKPAPSLPWFKDGPCNFSPFKSLHKPFPQIWYKVNFSTCEILTNPGLEKYELKKFHLTLSSAFLGLVKSSILAFFSFKGKKNSENDNKWHLVVRQYRATSWNYVPQTSKNLLEDTFLNVGPNICS